MTRAAARRGNLPTLPMRRWGSMRSGSHRSWPRRCGISGTTYPITSRSIRSSATLRRTRLYAARPPGCSDPAGMGNGFSGRQPDL